MVQQIRKTDDRKQFRFVSFRFSWLSQRAVWKISFLFCEDGRGVPFIRVNRKRLVSFHSDHRRSTTPSNGKQFSGLPGARPGRIGEKVSLEGEDLRKSLSRGPKCGSFISSWPTLWCNEFCVQWRASRECQLLILSWGELISLVGNPRMIYMGNNGF